MTSTCPLCEATGTGPHHEEAGHRYRRCTGCSLVFLESRPGPEELERLYQEEHGATFHHGAEIRGAFEKRLEADRRLGLVRGDLDRAPGRRVLEIGCGAGYLLERLRSDGWTVRGTELAEGYRRHAAEALGLEVTKQPPPGTFDAVLLFNVLSHLPDLPAAFRDLRRRLPAGGVLVLETGNAAEVPPARVGPFGAPEHLWHLSEPLLRSLLAEAGFGDIRVIRRNVEWQRGFLAWLGRRRAPRAAVAALPAAPRAPGGPPGREGLVKRLLTRFLLFLRFGMGRWGAGPGRFCTLFVTARAR